MRGPNPAQVTGKAEGLVPSTVLFRCLLFAHLRSAEGQDNGEQKLRHPAFLELTPGGDIVTESDCSYL